MIRFGFSAALILAAAPSLTFAQAHDHSKMPMHDPSSMAMTGDGEFNPFVISDAHGGFYSVYIQRKSDKSDVYFQHAPAGADFSAAVRVNDVAGDAAVRNENPPKIAAGPNGEIYVAWANERQRWKGNIRFSRSVDGGKTFSPAIYLNTDTSGALIGRGFETIAVDKRGRVYVAWIDQRAKNNDFGIAEIWMAESDDNGKTFSHDRKILENVCDCCRLTLAIDPTGRMFISYRYVPPSGPMFRDIAVARSDDGGKTFQSSVVNHDGWELNGCPTNGASMSVDDSGRVSVVWFTAPGGARGQLWVASSTDHGASFGKPALLDPAQKQAKHADVIGMGDGTVLAAWDDVNDSSLVRWGIYDLKSGAVQVLGSEKNAQYPIVAASGKHMAVIAMQQDHPQLVRTIDDFTAR